MSDGKIHIPARRKQPVGDGIRHVFRKRKEPIKQGAWHQPGESVAELHSDQWRTSVEFICVSGWCD